MENNINISAICTITQGKIFLPTMMLRFVERQTLLNNDLMPSKIMVLQQLWADMNSSSRETEWRDVPLEKE